MSLVTCSTIGCGARITDAWAKQHDGMCSRCVKYGGLPGPRRDSAARLTRRYARDERAR